MKRYTIRFKELGEPKEKVLIAEDKDLDLLQKVLDYINEKYGCDSYTDGTDVWYTDRIFDILITVITEMQIIDVEG